MIVEVVGGAQAAPEVRVSDVDDLQHLQVAIGALTTEEVDQALRDAGMGRLADEDTALLDIAALRAAAGALTSAGAWDEAFDGMVEYARGKGWIGDDGTTVQVHLETAASG
jgi:hypothetical protein